MSSRFTTFYDSPYDRRGAAGYSIAQKKSAQRGVRRPATLVVRIFLVENGVKQYKRALNSSLTSFFDQPLLLSTTINLEFGLKSGPEPPPPLLSQGDSYNILVHSSFHLKYQEAFVSFRGR